MVYILYMLFGISFLGNIKGVNVCVCVCRRRLTSLFSHA